MLAIVSYPTLEETRDHLGKLSPSLPDPTGPITESN